MKRLTLMCLVALSASSCGDAPDGGGTTEIETILPSTSVKSCVTNEGGCRIYWSSVGSIGGGDSPDGLDPVGGMPIVDSQDRVYVAASTPGVIVVWDLDGTVIKTLGSQGEGPGEMVGLPVAQVANGDTIYLRDDAGTLSVYTPDLQFVRKLTGVALPMGMYLGLTPDGHLIDAWGDPLFRVVTSDGDDIVSFGTPEPTEKAPRRVLSTGRRSDRFWAVPEHRLVLTEWGLDGSEYRRVEVPDSRFPRRSSDLFWGEGSDEPPPAVITNLVEDAGGLLWFRAMIPDPDYSASPPGVKEPLTDQADRMYDFLIEVIDPTSGRVVASSLASRMRDSLSGLLPGGWGFRISEDGLGFQQLEFGELSLGGG